METFRARGLAPDAVLASNDSLALGVELWCQREGRSVPGDIALVGFDDIEFARFTTVPVTTVAYPVAVIVRAAVARLIELIAARDGLPPPEQKVIKPELLVRSSTTG
jgi:LacI family transcriptional regulator